MNDLLKLFSLIFSYPNEETIKESIEIASKLGLKELKEELENIDLNKLQIEYTRLFVNTFPKIPCPPYESYYVEGQVYGNSSISAKKYYAKHGLVFDYASEPADHVSVELEFLALTCDKQFIKRFNKWFPIFAKCVKRHSKYFYGPVLDFILENISEDVC